MRNTIIYDGHVFTSDGIESVQIHKAASLPVRQLEADTITAVVKSEDDSIRNFKRNTPLHYYHIGSQMKLLKARDNKLLADADGRLLLLDKKRHEKNLRESVQYIFYLQTVERVGERSYRLYGTSAVGLLMEKPHVGGIYTGQRAEDVILDICGTVPVMVKTSLADIRLYGWLPYANGKDRSARDNLLEVLFAIGATMTADLNGVLRVQTMWDGMSAFVPRGKLYRGAESKTESPVSEVSVTEHQYIPGNEEEVLFEGTAQAGERITFNSPMHSLTATGFSILDSGANWARLSAGTGTLAGKSYVHTTREIREAVEEGAEENVKAEDGCTLVSLVNSRAAAQRLASYYGCREAISCSIVARSERPGYVVGIYHPYDKAIVPACVFSMDTTASSVLKSESKALVGFKPPQHAQRVGYDRRVLLTGAGRFVVPEGVEHIRGVLIEEGVGGWSGLPGGPAAEQKTVRESGGVQVLKLTKYYAEGGKGGKAGEGGPGGKIFQFEADVEPGQVFEYSCGPGGLGGPYGGEESAPGSAGTETSFGGYSSAMGSQSEAGFLDPVSNTVFGGAGEPGVDGGQGCGSGGEGNSADPVAGGPVVYQGKTYYPGNATKTVRDTYQEIVVRYEWVQAEWSEGLGGGAAAGSNGQDGGSDGSMSANRRGASARGGSGGNGADAAAPPAEARYGRGGRGGNGGGGAGSPGLAEVVHICNSDVTPSALSMALSEPALGTPGRGSEGGRGGPGCVLLYFTAYQERPGGALMTRDGKFLLDRFGRLLVV